MSSPSMHRDAASRLTALEALMHVRDTLDGVIAYRSKNRHCWADDLSPAATAAAEGCPLAEAAGRVLDAQLKILRAERDELQRRIDELFSGLPAMFADVARSLRPPRIAHNMSW